jgi:hypothetical protein
VNDDDVSLAAAGGPQGAGVLRSEAVFVGDTLPWSTLVELLRFFGCFGCGSGRGRSSRSIAAVAVVLSAGEVKPRARDGTSIAGGVPTPVAAPDKRSLCAPRTRSLLLSASCTELTSTEPRTPVGSFARTRVPGRNRSCTGRRWGLDSDECFVANALAQGRTSPERKRLCGDRSPGGVEMGRLRESSARTPFR